MHGSAGRATHCLCLIGRKACHADSSGLVQSVMRRSTPGVILVELHPQAVESSGYDGGAVRLLQQVYDWGYTHVSHAGNVCDERWYNITRSIRLKGAMGLAAQEALKQPTWCKLFPESFATLVQRASPKFPELILFAYVGTNVTDGDDQAQAGAPSRIELPGWRRSEAGVGKQRFS